MSGDIGFSARLVIYMEGRCCSAIVRGPRSQLCGTGFLVDSVPLLMVSLFSSGDVILLLVMLGGLGLGRNDSRMQSDKSLIWILTVKEPIEVAFLLVVILLVLNPLRKLCKISLSLPPTTPNFVLLTCC